MMKPGLEEAVSKLGNWHIRRERTPGVESATKAAHSRNSLTALNLACGALVPLWFRKLASAKLRPIWQS
jgi:hypothetical protein